MLKICLGLGMVAFTLHLASASHPAVEGERYVHSTASPSVAPPLEPKIKTEASRLILQSDDVELRLDSRFQATSIGDMISDISTLKAQVAELQLGAAARNSSTDARFESLDQRLERIVAGLTDSPTTIAPTLAPTADPTTLAPSATPSGSPTVTAPSASPTSSCQTDCATIKSANPSAESGRYTICPVPSAPFTAYCDMRHGGWTQVGTIQTQHGASGQGYSNLWNTWGGGWWTNQRTIDVTRGGFGGPNPHADYKNPGWWQLNAARVLIISTHGERNTVMGTNPGGSCAGSIARIYANNMIPNSQWNRCGCRFVNIGFTAGNMPGGAAWNTIGMAGCGDNSNENSLLQVSRQNAGGYFHNRGACMAQNSWGEFGSCSGDRILPTHGGAMIFVKQ